MSGYGILNAVSKASYAGNFAFGIWDGYNGNSPVNGTQMFVNSFTSGVRTINHTAQRMTAEPPVKPDNPAGHALRQFILSEGLYIIGYTIGAQLKNNPQTIGGLENLLTT